LARKAAAKKRLAGLNKRAHPLQTGVLPNSDFGSEFDLSSINEGDNNNEMIRPDTLSGEKSKIELPPPPRVVNSETYLMERAQELLSRVKSATGQNSSSSSSFLKPDINVVETHTVSLTKELVTINGTSSKEFNWSSQRQNLEIDWLLRGVPEIYEETEIISDELVERLILEGGKPPSQLEYPILYSTNQAILSRLHNVRQLHLQLDDLFIFGARCGLRKDGSFLLIRPPPGCYDLHDHERIRTPLFINVPPPSPQELFPIKHKNVLKHYHVGNVPLKETIVWNVDLTDSLIRDWFNYSAATGLNCIQLEIYSSLTPPPPPPSSSSSSSKKKINFEQKKTSGRSYRRHSAMLIGYAHIPLIGLFSSPNLAINLSVSIVLDQASHTLIVDRLQRLPIGVKLKPLPLSGSAGYVKCRLTLCDEFGQILNPSSSSLEKTTDSQFDQLNSIITFQEDENKIEMKCLQTDLDEALKYVPIELAPISQFPKYLCVAIHHITFTNIELFLSQLNLPIDQYSQIEISCAYKIALSSSRSAFPPPSPSSLMIS
jgi:hypothetical protein